MSGAPAPERLPAPYQLGVRYQVMPIPPVREHCVPVDAGPVRFVVESRRLTNAILRAELPETAAALPADVVLDDVGPTLHVEGAADGREHLRFDCFEHEPHYHYVIHATGENLVVRIDEVAEGDPVAWAIGRVRNRLPEMLELAGAPELAAEVRSAAATVASAVDRLGGLLDAARLAPVPAGGAGS